MVNYRYEAQVDVDDGRMPVGIVFTGAGRMYTPPIGTAHKIFLLPA